MNIAVDPVKRTAPREFKQYATITFQGGEQIFAASDHSPTRMAAGSQRANRACFKDGRSKIGAQWFFIWGHRMYYVMEGT